MRCTVCRMPIYPRQARTEESDRGPAHLECEVERRAKERKKPESEPVSAVIMSSGAVVRIDYGRPVEDKFNLATCEISIDGGPSILLTNRLHAFGSCILWEIPKPHVVKQGDKVVAFVDGRSVPCRNNAGTAIVSQMETAFAERIRATPPAIWENGRNLTVYFDGPLSGCRGHSVAVEIDRMRERDQLYVGLDNVISFGPATAIYELPAACVVRRGDKVRLSTHGASGGIIGLDCENRSIVDAAGNFARDPEADQERRPEPESKQLDNTYEWCFKAWGESGRKEASQEPNFVIENPDRSEAPESQRLTVFARSRAKGFFIAVVVPGNEPLGTAGVNAIIDGFERHDPSNIDATLRSIVERVAREVGTDNVAGRYVCSPVTIHRGSVFVVRRGVFQYDHALWAEFLRMIG